MTRETIERVHHNLENLKKAGEMSSHSITGSLMKASAAFVGIGAAIAGAASIAVFEFAEHSDRLSLAISQAGAAAGATAAQVRELEEIAHAKGMDSLYFSSIAAAESLRDLAREGFNANEAAKALDGTLMLTRISMGALNSGDAAAIIHDSLKMFGMQASQAGELTDKLAFAMRNFGFQASELRGAMSGLASGAQLVGASLDDTLIAVGLVHSAFPSATRSAAAMNMALQQLASTRVQKELRGIGVSVTDASGKILPLIDIIDSLNAHTSKMTQAQLAQKLETIAGGRAAGGLSAIIEGLRKGVTDTTGKIITGGDAVAYLRDQMANTNGTAKAMSDMLGTTMGGSLTALKNAISNAATEIGKGFEGPLMTAFQGANLFIRGLTQLFTQGGFSGEVKEGLDKHLGIKEFATGVFMWVERIRSFFSNLGDSFSTTFKPFRPILDQLIGTFSMLGHSLGLTSQSAGDNAAVWDTFGSAGGGVGSILANIAGSVLPFLVTGMQLVAEAAGEIRIVISTISPVLGGLWKMFQGVFGMIGGLLSGDWKKMWDGFVDVVVGAASAVVRLVLGAMGQVASVIDSIGSAFGHDFGLSSSVASMQSAMNSGTIERGADVLKSVVAPKVATAVASSDRMIAGVSEHSQAFQEASLLSTALKEGAHSKSAEYIQAHISIDGQKVFDAVMKAKRDKGSLSFDPVGAF